MPHINFIEVHALVECGCVIELTTRALPIQDSVYCSDHGVGSVADSEIVQCRSVNMPEPEFPEPLYLKGF